MKPCFGLLFKWFMSCLPPMETQDPTEWMWLSFGSTFWWMFTRCYSETMSSFRWISNRKIRNMSKFFTNKSLN
jgi:hypothetical protein